MKTFVLHGLTETIVCFGEIDDLGKFIPVDADGTLLGEKSGRDIDDYEIFELADHEAAIIECNNSVNIC